MSYKLKKTVPNFSNVAIWRKDAHDKGNVTEKENDLQLDYLRKQTNAF